MDSGLKKFHYHTGSVRRDLFQNYELSMTVLGCLQKLPELRKLTNRLPFTFFGGIGLAFILAGGILGIWVILDYLEDEYVNKVPTSILATGFMLLGFGSMGIGILLNTINYRFRENMRQLHKISRSR